MGPISVFMYWRKENPKKEVVKASERQEKDQNSTSFCNRKESITTKEVVKSSKFIRKVEELGYQDQNCKLVMSEHA